MEKLSAEQKPDPLGGKTTRKGSRELGAFTCVA